MIKKTLRLFPPAGTSCQVQAGENLVSYIGQVCPTDSAIVWIPHTPPLIASSFLPERLLVGSKHDLYPKKGPWRTFEHGGRNCMAQGLVKVELRVLLAMLIRSFILKMDIINGIHNMEAIVKE